MTLLGSFRAKVNLHFQVTSVECDPPENPVNGKAVYTSYAYNSVVSYECKNGYTIPAGASSTRRCGADGKWTGQSPSCREINCGSPGILYNGWIDNVENGKYRFRLYRQYDARNNIIRFPIK